MAIQTVVFDAYGTLFDVTAAARNTAADPDFPQLAETWETLAADWRTKQLEYTWLRAVTGDHCDFAQVTENALDWALEAQSLTDPALRARLLQLYQELDAYPEVAETLAALKAAGKNVALLSNGSPEMLASAVASAGITDHLDATLSVEQVGVFKPAPKVYDLVTATFGTPRGQVLFVSSNGWDVCSAAAYGFRTAWVNRAQAPMDRLSAKPDRVLSDLTDIPRIATGMMRGMATSGAEIGETRYFTNRDGLRLAYRDDGLRDGPVVLCLCGLTRNMADFDYVARDFADRARILRLDTRGRGQSDWDPAYLNYDLEHESQDAIDLLDHLGIARTAILGTSRGGLISMVLAQTHKNRLTGVCLNDIGPEIDQAGLIHIAGYLGIRPTVPDTEAAADMFTAAQAGKFPTVTRARWKHHAERIYCDSDQGLDLRYDAMLRNAVFEQSATDKFPDLWTLFRGFGGLPLALIRGTHSDILSAQTAQKMTQQFPGMLYGEVPDRGHVPFLDEPEAQDILAQFLKALPQ